MIIYSCKANFFQASETAGDKWFKLGTKDVDEDTQMDLQFLQLRNFTDPKKFMKQKELEIPKHFEVCQCNDVFVLLHL
jgi:hypothetical protein